MINLRWSFNLHGLKSKFNNDNNDKIDNNYIAYNNSSLEYKDNNINNNIDNNPFRLRYFLI
jgi:hypothetical protein